MNAALLILGFVAVIFSFFSLLLSAYVICAEHISKLNWSYIPEEDTGVWKHLDTTAGIRHLAFLQDAFMGNDIWNMHPLLREEFEFLCLSSCEMVRASYDNPDNKWYFDNLVADTDSWQDVVMVWFKPEFVDYLSRIHAFEKK